MNTNNTYLAALLRDIEAAERQAKLDKIKPRKVNTATPKRRRRPKRRTLWQHILDDD